MPLPVLLPTIAAMIAFTIKAIFAGITGGAIFSVGVYFNSIRQINLKTLPGAFGNATMALASSTIKTVATGALNAVLNVVSSTGTLMHGAASNSSAISNGDGGAQESYQDQHGNYFSTMPVPPVAFAFFSRENVNAWIHDAAVLAFWVVAGLYLTYQLGQTLSHYSDVFATKLQNGSSARLSSGPLLARLITIAVGTFIYITSSILMPWASVSADGVEAGLRGSFAYVKALWENSTAKDDTNNIFIEIVEQLRDGIVEQLAGLGPAEAARVKRATAGTKNSMQATPGEGVWIEMKKICFGSSGREVEMDNASFAICRADTEQDKDTVRVES
jgi:hypothetical protein